MNTTSAASPQPSFELLALALAGASVAASAAETRRCLDDAAEHARALAQQLGALGVHGLPELLRILAGGLQHPELDGECLADQDVTVLAGWIAEADRLLRGALTPDAAEHLLRALEQITWLPAAAPRMREYLLARLREAAAATARTPLTERAAPLPGWEELDEELHLAMAEFGDEPAPDPAPGADFTWPNATAPTKH